MVRENVRVTGESSKREGSVTVRLCVFVLAVCLGLPGLFSSSACVPIRPDLLERLEKEGRLKDFVEAQRPLEEDACERGLDAPASRLPFSPRRLSVNAVSPANLRVAVVLVDFYDNPADTVNFPPSYYERLFFSVGELPSGSLRDYFLENSHGTLDVVGSVSHWVRMPLPYSYYVAGKKGIGLYPQNAQKLAEDAAHAGDWEINFANCDNDGPDGVPDSGDDDGYVDAFFVIHAGQGYETTLDSTKIISHTWTLMFEQIVDGVKAFRYTMGPENGTIGVYCHEFGHLLGLSDLYDRDYSSRGLGGWSLMAFGEWNALGTRPGHLDPWSKLKAGFATPVVPTSDVEGVSFPPVEREPVIYKLWDSGTGNKEYFLVERREKIGFDDYLPGHGLLIYHVDETVFSNDVAFHYRVGLEQADGLWHLENNINPGDSGDPYPGSSHNSVFGYETVPNSLGYGGIDSRVRVFDITQVDTLITANIWVKQGPKIYVYGFTVKDSLGNNDGNIDPGETVSLRLCLRNSGSQAADVTGVLVPRSSCIEMGSSSADFGTMPANSETWSSPPFVFTVSDTLSADPFGAWFDLSVCASSGYCMGDSVLVGIGKVFGFKDNMEHPDGWEHYPARVGWLDEWHLSTARFFEGESSWACANVDSGVYSPRNDAVLVSPVILLRSEPRLSFYHWIDAHVDTGAARAGGFVEISSNGSSWTQLSPNGGYPFQLKAGEDFSAGNAGVFSGNVAQWQRAEFDLSAYSNSAIRLRFRFVSDRDSVVGGGWYIDSLGVTTTFTPVWITSLTASEADGCVILSWSADTELQSVPFSVWRSPAPDGAEGTCLIKTQTMFENGGYGYKDCTVIPDVEYRYWVAVEGNPDVVCGPVVIRTRTRVAGPPRLDLVSTNPVADVLRLRVWVPGSLADGHISVRLFDASGRFVRSLYDGRSAPGTTSSEPMSLEWDTKDCSGKRVGSGVYFLKFEWPAGAVVRKVVVLRSSGGL